MIRVLLVDDQPLVRQGWRMRLALEADIAIIGEAGDGRQAVEMASALRPDVIVMDVEMPVADGISAVEQLQAAQLAATVVMITIHDDAGTRARARAAGATAFIGKQEPADALLTAIRQVVTR